jgi:hypothetical protein
MSLNLANASLSPSTVYTNAQFIISIEVYDDEFEFDSSYPVYDEHQGFANEDQTIGGKLVQGEDPTETYRGITTSDGYKLIDSNGNYIKTKNDVPYTSSHTGAEINAFIKEVLG